MNLQEALKTRRSVRTYSNEVPSQELIEKVIEMACYAPSAHNQQAWTFFLIAKAEDRNFLGEVMEF